MKDKEIKEEEKKTRTAEKSEDKKTKVSKTAKESKEQEPEMFEKKTSAKNYLSFESRFIILSLIIRIQGIYLHKVLKTSY